MNRKIVLLALSAAVFAFTTGCGNKKNDDKATAPEKMTSEMTGTAGDAATDSVENDDSVNANASDSKEDVANVLQDGVYLAEFNTDSPMFHVNEMKDGKGKLVVENGQMTIEIALVSKNIVNLYPGLAQDAEADEANWIKPGTELIDYGDGTSEEVNCFVVPVGFLDKEFDLAILGKKGKWYDHKVSVNSPEPYAEDKASDAPVQTETDAKQEPSDTVAIGSLEDGEYQIDVTLSGGSGKTTVESPAVIKLEAGKAYATITLSSPNYDYMLVNGERYDRINTEGNSSFCIPVDAFDYEMPVVGDTTAMSKPHEIEYTLYFDSTTLK